MLGHFFIWIKWKLMALFPLHGTARYGSVRLTFGGFSTGYSTWYFFFTSSTTSAGVPSEPYSYQNVTCKLCWSLIGRRKSSLLRHWTLRDTTDALDLNQHSQRRIERNCFEWAHLSFNKQKRAVWLSVEEVQTFLSFIAEERIQRELDGVDNILFTIEHREHKNKCFSFIHQMSSFQIWCLLQVSKKLARGQQRAEKARHFKSNHFYCHITTAQVPWWVKFLWACSRQCKKNKTNNIHMDSTYLQTVQKTMCKIHIHILSTHSVL